MLQYCPADITEKFGKESFGMKKKYIGTVFFSLLLLLLFLPVFFYVIYYGNNVDYNAMHKIVTVEGNRSYFYVRSWEPRDLEFFIIFSENFQPRPVQ